MTKQHEIKDVQPIRSLDQIADMKWRQETVEKI